MPKTSGLPDDGSAVPSDAAADIACIEGNAGLLSRYLLLQPNPARSVLEFIGLCLLAGLSETADRPEGRILSLATRNGRPPKDLELQRISLVKRFLARRSNAPGPSRKVVRHVAELLKPISKSKLQLKFRRRQGFPRSQLENSLRLAVLGHQALELHDAGDSWNTVYYDREFSESDRQIQKAVQFVRRARAGKLTD